MDYSNHPLSDLAIRQAFEVLQARLSRERTAREGPDQWHADADGNFVSNAGEKLLLAHSESMTRARFRELLPAVLNGLNEMRYS